MSAAVERQHVQVGPAPHIVARENVSQIMVWVIVALMPATLWAVWNMGVVAVVLLVACIGSAIGTERVWNRFTRRPQTLMDGSAALTGLLLALTLPPCTPWWMGVAGGIVAIGLAKMLFGGLGWNLFNPALVGRAVLTVSWAGVLGESTPYPGGWFHALDVPAHNGLDAITGATRLAIASADRLVSGGYGIDLASHYQPLLLRNLEGSLGEVSGLLLIAGGLVLVVKRIIDWRIPAAYIGTVAVLSWAFGSDPVFNVLAGGILLGAFFMATDPVTSPMTRWGRVVFGCGCGVFNTVVRFFGPMPEATTFAILFMNGLVPFIDRAFAPRTFGWARRNG